MDAVGFKGILAEWQAKYQDICRLARCAPEVGVHMQYVHDLLLRSPRVTDTVLDKLLGSDNKGESDEMLNDHVHCVQEISDSEATVGQPSSSEATVVDERRVVRAGLACDGYGSVGETECRVSSASLTGDGHNDVGEVDAEDHVLRMGLLGLLRNDDVVETEGRVSSGPRDCDGDDDASEITWGCKSHATDDDKDIIEL